MRRGLSTLVSTRTTLCHTPSAGSPSSTGTLIDGAVPIVAEVTRDAARELALAPGHTVVASVKATEVTVYPA